MAMEKSQPVTAASNMQPPQQSTTTVSPQSTPLIFARKKTLAINPSTVHQRIFEAIKEIDETAAIITHKKSESQTVIPSPPTKNTKYSSQTKEYVKSQNECTFHSL